MGEAKFTKGKWLIGVNHEITDDTAANNEIALVGNWDQCPWVSDANRNLIAAAPEMYKALIRIQQEGGLSVARHKSISKLLKKARGES